MGVDVEGNYVRKSKIKRALLTITSNVDIKTQVESIQNTHSELVTKIRDLMNIISDIEKNSKSAEIKKACEESYDFIKGSVLYTCKSNLQKYINNLYDEIKPIDDLLGKTSLNTDPDADKKQALEQINRIGDIKIEESGVDLKKNRDLAKDILKKCNFMFYGKEEGYTEIREKWLHRQDKTKRIVLIVKIQNKKANISAFAY